MEKTLEVYIKANSNCPGMPLIAFTMLSPVWQGEHLVIPFGEDEERKDNTVVGWTDLFFGSRCPLRVVRVQTNEQAPREGYLVYGGSNGIRVLDEHVPLTPGIDDHLPRGYGRPILWIEDLEALPEEVRTVVAPLHL